MFPEALQGWPLAAIALSAIALILFAIAIRTGRWGVWLAGYAVVLLALTAVIAANRHPEEPEPAADSPDVQPSSVSGVMLPVSGGTGSGEAV